MANLPGTYRRDCLLGALGAALMLVSLLIMELDVPALLKKRKEAHDDL